VFVRPIPRDSRDIFAPDLLGHVHRVEAGFRALSSHFGFRLEHLIGQPAVRFVSEPGIGERLAEIVRDRFYFLFDELVETLEDEFRLFVGSERNAGTSLR